MYGLTNKSWPQRITIVMGEVLFLVIAYWILFINRNALFHLPAGNLGRNILLFTFCIVTFFRMSFMVVYLLKRGISWGETSGVLTAFALYYVGFSILGGIQNIRLDGFDEIAVALFAAGSAINSISEWLRNQWKKDKKNKGKLYTGGLFKYAMHINYFGDIVWVCGFTLLTRNIWTLVIPIFLLIMFIFGNIPNHDRYLREKYGDAFVEYAKKTKKLIPFIY